MQLNFISWGSPENLLYVIGLALCAVGLLIWRVYKTQSAVVLLSSPARLKQFLVNYSFIKLLIKTVLLCIGFICLSLVLLRPRWSNKEEVVAQKGRDLFIALDVSRSMLAKDCTPNRLECAKNKIKALIKQLSCERIGLILFSGSAFVRCPLTTDYAAFIMFLDQVDVETIASGTTALDQVFFKVLDAYKAFADRKTKLLVVLTDGEDFSSSLAQAKKQLAEQNIKVFTIGVGTTQGAPIPLFDEIGRQVGHLKDKKGTVVISRLNEGILNNVAQESGGAYVGLTADDSDIKTIAQLVSSFEKEKIEDRKISHLEEQYTYFLLVTFICFILEWLL